MFLYVLIREIRGYLRERSGFAAICVGIFALDLKDHEWARMITNFPGRMDPLYSGKLVIIRGRNDSRKGMRARGSEVERGNIGMFRYHCSGGLRPFAFGSLFRF